jgi:hypothetical protein
MGIHEEARAGGKALPKIAASRRVPHRAADAIG